MSSRSSSSRSKYSHFLIGSATSVLKDDFIQAFESDEASFGKTSAPDIKMFIQLKEHWTEVNTSLQIRTVNIPKELRDELLDFYNSLLEEDHFICGDYKELAELSVVLLGGNLPGGKLPEDAMKKHGACQKARFMAFGLLILKIFAFSEQQVVKTHCLSEVIEVEIDEEENEKPRKKTKQSDKKKKKTKKVTVYSQELEDKVTRFCVYALKFYIPTFFKSSRGCDAPSNDLKLYKDLLGFRSIDETLAASALATMDRHRWYLAPSVVMFSLFSKQVSDDTKARMVAKLLTFEKPEKKRVGLPAFPTLTGESQLWDLVTEESWDFFTILKVPVDWLTWPPMKWEESEHFRRIEKFVTTAKVINDTAERAIKLASDYTKSLTKDSKMRQKLFQTVEWHRREKAGRTKKSTANK